MGIKDIDDITEWISNILTDDKLTDFKKVKKISEIWINKKKQVGEDAALKIYLKYLTRTTVYNEKVHKNNISLYSDNILKKYENVENKLKKKK